MEWGLLAASAWARRLEEVPLEEKKRPTTGWRKEWKTTWAPLRKKSDTGLNVVMRY